MGAKTWMLVGCDGSPKDIFTNSPVLDREGARELARRMFPRGAFTDVGDGDLSSTNPPESIASKCRFGEVTIATKKKMMKIWTRKKSIRSSFIRWIWVRQS